MTDQQGEKTKRFKPNRWLAVLLPIISLLLIGSFQLGAKEEPLPPEFQKYGIVTIKGEEVYRIQLTEDTPRQGITLYPSEDEYTIIESAGTKIRIKEDSKGETFATEKGWIDQPGESSVSLDHSLQLKIVTSFPKNEQRPLTGTGSTEDE